MRRVEKVSWKRCQEPFCRHGKGVRNLFVDSFARAVAFAISQPEDVDVNEILFRPTRQEL